MLFYPRADQVEAARCHNFCKDNFQTKRFQILRIHIYNQIGGIRSFNGMEILLEDTQMRRHRGEPTLTQSAEIRLYYQWNDGT